MTDWNEVGQVLLASWPSQVASWGREVIAGYCTELEARGVTPERALDAIRSCPANKAFPPSAPELAGMARRDPSLPTAVEALQMIYGKGGVIRARLLPGQEFESEAAMESARDVVALERARELHPMLGAFVARVGPRRLREVELGDPEYGELRRRELREAWDEHCDAMEGRDLAAIASGQPSGLRRLDPLAALGVSVPQIEAANTQQEG